MRRSTPNSINKRGARSAFALLAILFIVPCLALAQSGGAADGTGAASSGTAPDGSSASATSAPASGAGGNASPQLSPQPVPQQAAATTSSAQPRPAPAAAQPAQSAIVPAVQQQTAGTSAVPVATDSGVVAADDGPNLLVRAAALLLLIIPLGFLVAYVMRTKPKRTSQDQKTRCYDIEQLMKEKFAELTDLKALAQDKAVDMGKELMADLVTGTKTGDALLRLQKVQAEYDRLKLLFEECQISYERYRYRGVLIENSLLDKKVLDHVRVVSTRHEGDWIVHDIRLSEKQIEAIQQQIANKQWYFHLWEPGSDDVTVVFKDAIFKLRYSDKKTWKKAIAHGIAGGIPESQLDFKIEQ